MAIKVYYSPACPACKKLLEFLNDNKIEFESIDVSENQEQAKNMISKTGDYVVPVIEIDGKVVEGFDEKKLREELNIK